MSQLSDSNRAFLESTAKAIVTPGKGILAADESTGTMGKRLAPTGAENNEENRRFYRQLLFTTPNMEKFISGVILFDETFYQSTDDGVRFIQLLKNKGVKIGIKVDKGLIDIPGTDGEQTTKGLDDLAVRCAKYKAEGADFAKWRCILKISDKLPSDTAIESITDVLAEYASICQAEGLVPIVEPEIMTDGDHDLAKCADVTRRVLCKQYAKLAARGVLLEGSLLKPNMVTPGNACADKFSADAVAKETVDALLASVPATVPGICFLSGGQSETDSSVHLNAMNSSGVQLPWRLSFSYGRALQASALRAWAGVAANKQLAQDEFVKRAKMNGDATRGKYDSKEETNPAAQVSQFVVNYTY